MPFDRLWSIYQVGGYAAACATVAADAAEYFYLALLAFGEGELAAATAYARAAVVAAPEDLFYAAAANYLAHREGSGKQQAYAAAEGFGAFIRGGGNVPLYTATSAALRRHYLRYPHLRLLDIGVGDGLALLPALTPNIQRLDLVEPATALLDRTREQLDAQGIAYQRHTCTLQTFVAGEHGPWDVAQATFSLQSIPPANRAPLFHWLRDHCTELLIAEFDTPEFSHLYAAERVASITARYRRGLTDYSTERELVAQGFLMPVFFGAFDPTADRVNYEHPIAEWIAQLHTAGFGHVESELLYTYWWGPAKLVVARRT